MPSKNISFSNKRIIMEQDLALLGELETKIKMPTIKKTKRKTTTNIQSRTNNPDSKNPAKIPSSKSSKKTDYLHNPGFDVVGLDVKTSKDKSTALTHVPSDRDFNESISNAVFDKNRNYIGFTRYEDEPVVKYLHYTGIIHTTEEEFSYNQKFLIDPNIGKPFIDKYKTLGKNIELLIAEYPMIGAGCIGVCAAIISGTTLWFINRLLEKYVLILFS